MTCATPGCEDEATAGRFGRFCEACAARLAKLREDLADGSKEKYRIWGTSPGYESED